MGIHQFTVEWRDVVSLKDPAIKREKTGQDTTAPRQGAAVPPEAERVSDIAGYIAHLEIELLEFKEGESPTRASIAPLMPQTLDQIKQDTYKIAKARLGKPGYAAYVQDTLVRLCFKRGCRRVSGLITASGERTIDWNGGSGRWDRDDLELLPMWWREEIGGYVLNLTQGAAQPSAKADVKK